MLRPRRASPEAGAGTYVRSRCFAFGITTHGIAITVAWGVLDAAEARGLATAWAGTFPGPPRDTLVDVTDLASADAEAFAATRELLEGHREERARMVRRQAIVAGDNYGGVFVRGYLAIYPPPYEVQHFERRADALAWLEHPCCAAELAELTAVREDVLARLRAWLDTAQLADATIERAAAELEITTRTLQRRLAAAGTRFVEELARAQVSRAQQLMRDPDRKLADIAREAGCATPSTFSDLFRRITGHTPTQWRRRTS